MYNLSHSLIYNLPVDMLSEYLAALQLDVTKTLEMKYTPIQHPKNVRLSRWSELSVQF